MNWNTIRSNPWPYAIIGYFVIFISAMSAWVVVAVRNDMDLVRDDYYEHEIRYQQQLDSLNRTARRAEDVSVAYNYEAQRVEIKLPFSAKEIPEGKIKFYRPSDATKDKVVNLALDTNGRQTVPTEALQGGFWRVQISWKTNGEDYYFEQPVVVSPKI